MPLPSPRPWPPLFCALICTVSACRPREAPSPSPQPAAAPSATPSGTPSAQAPASAALSSSAAPPAAPRPRHDVERAIDEAIERGDVKGAVLHVRRGAETVYEGAFGQRVVGDAPEAMTADTIFDLASLTKPLCTALLTMIEVDRGRLALSEQIGSILPATRGTPLSGITVEQLLLHTAGLEADDPLDDYAAGTARAVEAIARRKLVTAPGEAYRYSDVGYVLLGEVLRARTSQPLDALFRERVATPLSLTSTTFAPPRELLGRTAPTADEAGRELRAVVHDPRARAAGGVAGHAGLFATASEVATIAASIAGIAGSPSLLSQKAREVLLRSRSLPGDKRRSLGFEILAGSSVRDGKPARVEGHGHTGFTGTLVWVDPPSGVVVTLLTSRTYPAGKGDVAKLRTRVLGAVGKLLAGEASAPTVQAGIDALERDGFSSLRLKRVALLANEASVNAAGERTIDVLRRAEGVTVVALLAPEHGVSGASERAVRGGVDGRTGLRVQSVFGHGGSVASLELDDIDTIVVDLVDVGARFFTYATTMGRVIEAASRRGVKVVVLDRPNPLGGALVDGPMLDPGREGATAFTTLPVQHGMTIGELARHFARERALEHAVTVVPVEGWKRSQRFSQRGERWRRPSPNLTSYEGALLYPGVGMLELCNVSVGRGTETPFRVVGAPWVSGERLERAMRGERLAGVSFKATTFTPVSGPFRGERCEGVRIDIDDEARLRPVLVGLSLARHLIRTSEGVFKPSGLLTLMANREVYDMVLAGADNEHIEAVMQRQLAPFLQARQGSLMYD